MRIQTKSLESAVFTQVEMGTCLSLLNLDYMIPREKTSEELVNLFFPKLNLEDDREMHMFGLIVGRLSDKTL